MIRVQKDLTTKLLQGMSAWERLRPHKQFFGYTLERFQLAAKSFLDARKEIADLEAAMSHAASKRDAAAKPLLEIWQGVVSAVKGDPQEGQNGELYAAMGYIPKNQRATGLVRRRKADSPPSEQDGLKQPAKEVATS